MTGRKCVCSIGIITALIMLANGQNPANNNEKGIIECDEFYIPCDNQRECYLISNQCDDLLDCTDFSDEKYCDIYNEDDQTKTDEESKIEHEGDCRSDEFQCATGDCIHHTYECDGIRHCLDNSDEKNCNNNVEEPQKSCEADQFMCSSGACISLALACDYSEDCIDGSDEVDCCALGTFKCHHDHYTQCIEAYKTCDNNTDCDDGSDEFDCGFDHKMYCDDNQFHCSSGECVELSLQCNNHNDCHDGSDELNCHEECGQDQFACHSGTQCIPLYRHCDGYPDCLDRSDELNCAAVKTGTIPHFPQAPKSYIVLPKLEEAYLRFNFEITFKPERPNGLILYNGQRRGGGDYIALSLNERYVEFRFDFGLQPTILRAEKPINLHEWHSVKVNRIRADGFMIVDNQTAVWVLSLNRSQGLELNENLYLGGVPKFEDIASTATEFKEGFVGCISRLVLRDRVVELNEESISVKGTTSCEPCADDPCANDGVCLEAQTENGYACVCMDGFTGKNCAIKGYGCLSHTCDTGRCLELDEGIQCLCPLNKTGDRCQDIVHLDEENLSFTDGSFAAYKAPEVTKMNIKFSIRPENLKDSVVLYIAESERSNGGFTAVVIKDQNVEFRFGLGSRLVPTIIRSLYPIQAHKWREIVISLQHGKGALKVESEPQQTGKLIGTSRSMYLKTHLYIGGYDKRNHLNTGVGISRGFDGCISGLKVSILPVNLIADILEGVNLQNCGQIVEPGIPAKEICRPGFGGKNCEIIIDVCFAQNPCENGGLCKPKKGLEFNCDCPLGFTGDVCQHSIKIEIAGHFRGDGFIELDRDAISNGTTQVITGVAVIFSTSHKDGILIWYGQNKGEYYNGQDFVSLAVVNGFIEFSFRLNGEESVIHNPTTRVDDGFRHVAIIKREGNQASLELDYFIMHGKCRPTDRKEAFIPGHLFIGGAPDLGNLTGNRYTHGFNGCVHNIAPLDGDSINLKNKAISASNIDNCPLQKIKNPKIEYAEVGSNAILRCYIGHFPTEYLWSRRTGLLLSGQNYTNYELNLKNVQSKDAGSYDCTSIKGEEPINLTTILVVTGTIPHFPQAPKSYMVLPKIDDAYMRFNFVITFKPERNNGLILYNGQKLGDGDYIALSLNERFVEFRFDFGFQPTILRAEKPLTLREWHTVKVNRVSKDGFMIVDDMPAVSIPSSTKFQGLELNENMYLGGVPKFEDIASTATEFKEGFVGCISRLVLCDRVVELDEESIYVEGTTSCEPCADDPCANDGVCLEGQTENGYACVCMDGFSGKNCAIEGYSSRPGPTRPVVHQKPNITVTVSSPSLQIIKAGETIGITCTGVLLNATPINVKWLKLGGTFSHRTRDEQGILTIIGSHVDDSGTYQCRAQSGQEVVSRNVSIVVEVRGKERPTVSLNSPYIDENEYDPAEILCTATGNPSPTLSWIRLNGRMPSDVTMDDGYLRFNSLRKADEGEYRCLASNSAGIGDQLLIVYVKDYPTSLENEIILIYPPHFDGNPGDDVMLTCSSSLYRNIVWSKEGARSLPFSVHVFDEVLIIQNAQLIDSGTYICTTTSPHNRPYKTEAEVFIKDSKPSGTVPVITQLPESHTISEGTDYTLVCHAKGDPTPTIRWSMHLDNLQRNVIEYGNKLLIINAQHNNRGIYICIAENEIGTDESNTRIEIEAHHQYEAPKVELHPRDPKSIRIGDPVMINCRVVAGMPRPILTWHRRDGHPLSSRFRQEYAENLELDEAQIEDAGEYECRAENAAGSVTVSTVITVQYTPTVTLSPNTSHMELYEGDHLQIDCYGKGGPTPVLTWHTPNEHDDVPSHSPSALNVHLPSQTTIERRRATTRDAGRYECHATNEVGRGTTYIDVFVKIRDNIPVYTDRPTYIQQAPHYLDPYYFLVNDTSTLTCDVSGSYREATWRRADGRHLPYDVKIHGKKLIIDRTQEDAAGTYECVIDDGYNPPFAAVIVELVLIDAPRITFTPQMPIRVFSGSNVDIDCNAEGEQPIRILWHAEHNGPFPSSVSVDGNTLHFKQITIHDAGKYYCFASNVHGNVTKLAQVLV